MISQAPCATFGDPERGAERAGHNTETNGKNNAKRSTGTVKQKKGNQIKQNEISNKKVGAKIAKKNDQQAIGTRNNERSPWHPIF